jgi:ribosomal protein S18 acetylase RimI-like enzyme
MTTLEDAADLNLATHFTYVQRRVEGMRVRDEDGLVLTDCAMPCDTFNAVCRSRVREAIAWFADVDRPFSWWMGPGDTPRDLGTRLEAAGLERAETELAMSADVSALDRNVELPPGFEVRRGRTREELAAYAAINAANWSPSDQLVVRFYERAAEALLDASSPLRFYLGYLEGVPVATSELTVAGGVVGLYNVSTLEACRRRGFGSVLTRWPLGEAAREGYDTAILQASDAGVGVYRRIGFEPFGEITEFKPTNWKAASHAKEGGA